MRIFSRCAMRVSFARFGRGTIGRTLGHDFDFFASRSQCVLCGANDIFLAFPVGHLQRFLEGFNGAGVFAAVGQQAHAGQAQLALGGEFFVFGVRCFQVFERCATGQGGLDRSELLRLKLQRRNGLFACGQLFFSSGLFFSGLVNLGGQLGNLLSRFVAAAHLLPSKEARARRGEG